MPFVPITVPPGVVKVDSDYAASGRWIDTDKTRFDRNLPEKVGGVQKLTPDTFSGIARGANAWNAYAGTQLLLFGTACQLYGLQQGVITRITPYRTDATGLTLTNPFTMVNGSAIVNVQDTAHGITGTGTTVTFADASAAGGITIDGDYTVTSIVDADNFTITHSDPATSDTTGGGTVTASYEINCGPVDTDYLLGWGVGGWGFGYWGTDVSIANAVIVEPYTWAFGNYGEDLIVNPLNGGLYYFDASSGMGRPSRIANSPAQCRYVFVTPERYIIALGCTRVSGNQDGMVVRWPDVLDFTDWTPTTTNTANERTLQGGTRLIAGTALTDGLSLVWSNAGCFVFQFTGSAEVYASRMIAENCGLVGPQAFATANGAAFWMGNNELWMYAGYVQPIPNSVDIVNWVFDNVNEEQIFKSVAFFNAAHNEVWFLFPSGSSLEPDKYVMVNLDSYAWANGTWTRTAHAAFTTGENRPILFGTDGYIYAHETRNSTDEDGSAMSAHIELAPTDIDGGNTSVDIFGFVPDFQTQSGDISLYIYGRDNPRDSDFMSETIDITETDRLVDLRGVAGKQFGFKITSNTIGGDFRMGRPGLEISGAGQKRGSQD
jgi:hypothetical protein